MLNSVAIMTDRLRKVNGKINRRDLARCGQVSVRYLPYAVVVRSHNQVERNRISFTYLPIVGAKAGWRSWNVDGTAVALSLHACMNQLHKFRPIMWQALTSPMPEIAPVTGDLLV